MSGVEVVAAAVRGAASAEIAWVDDDGALHVLSEPAVMDGSEVVMILTADAGSAVASLAAAAQGLLTVTDGRGATPGWQPAAARIAVRADGPSDAWVDGPLHARLCACDPATRDLTGSPLLRREHWWAVPRHVVRASVTEVVGTPTARGDGDWLLVRRGGRGVHLVGVTTISDDGHVTADCSGCTDTDVLAVRTAPPSVPGAERVEVLRGRLRSGRLVVAHRSGRIEQRPGALLPRWRAERRLARACAAALADWPLRR